MFIKGFDEESIGLNFASPIFRVQVAEHQHQYFAGAGIGFESSTKTEAIKFWYQDFGHQDVGPQLPRPLQRRNAIADKLNGVARLLEEKLLQTLNGGIPLNDQNQRALGLLRSGVGEPREVETSDSGDDMFRSHEGGEETAEQK